MRRLHAVWSSSMVILAGLATASAACPPEWSVPTITLSYTTPRVVNSAQVQASVVWDDGTGGGPALYAAGYFRAGAPSRYYSSVLKWDGTNWTPVGGFLCILGNAASPAIIRSLAVFDDGTGTGNKTLYIAGQFHRQRTVNNNGVVTGVSGLIGEELGNIAKWDPEQNLWVPLNQSIIGTSITGQGSPNPIVLDMQTFDDGSGEKLYVCGDFLEVTPAFDGPNADDAFVRGMARWTGTDWEKVGASGAGLNEYPICMAAHDPDGAGEQPAVLVVGGRFTSSAAGPVTYATQWDGTTWSAIPDWSDTDYGLTGSGICEIGSFDMDGDGPQAPTLFFCPGDVVTAQGLAGYGRGPNATLRYDTQTQTWVRLSSEPDTTGVVQAMTLHNDGSDTSLYLGSKLVESLDDPTNFSLALMKWNGTELSSVGNSVNGNVFTLASFPHDQTQSLFVGGRYLSVDSTMVAAPSVAEWITPTDCCPADFNGDSVRDVADLFAYINAWLAKTPDADFNSDTTVDVADLFAYINAWLAGC